MQVSNRRAGFGVVIGNSCSGHVRLHLSHPGKRGTWSTSGRRSGHGCCGRYPGPGPAREDEYPGSRLRTQEPARQNRAQAEPAWLHSALDEGRPKGRDLAERHADDAPSWRG